MSLYLALDSPIEFVKGVGPVKGLLLNNHLKIFTIGDMLLHFPFRYIDRSLFTKIIELRADNEIYQLKVIVDSIQEKGFGKNKRLIASAHDESGKMELIWFQGIKGIQSFIQVGNEYVIFGKVNVIGQKYSMPHPEMELFDPHKVRFKFQPVYPSSEKIYSKGLDSKGLQKIVRSILEYLKPSDIAENLPDYILQKFLLISRYDGIFQLHFPTDEKTQVRALQRMKFEELLFLQLKIVRAKYYRQLEIKGNKFDHPGMYSNIFLSEHLPFKLTNAQERVMKEILLDMISGKQMNRLLQGDVGSGKTIIAFMTMLLAIDSGYQACLMAPTEVLANQHFVLIAELCKKLNIHCARLSSNVKGKDRRITLEGVRNGYFKILIGTHAVLEETVQFENLGLIVIDEQHRFGVEQRSKLWQRSKHNPPHILVMTATPIPRTLAMSLYGDLDVSIIDELPPGRKEIKTIHFRDAQRGELHNFMKNEISKGRQVYIVYPLIEESEKLDFENLDKGYEKLLESFPLPDYRISIVHGRMKPVDKQAEMDRFIEGKSQIMVATTVIEVGVNVPNASIMIIENAERFGLSQLHQLRGRVGRGGEQSYCILLTGNKLSQDGKSRINIMCATNDGFKIAEVDLQLRGPGDLEGTQQSGLLDLKVANVYTDNYIMMAAHKLAEAIITKDPELKNPINSPLKTYIMSMKDNKDWSRIS